MSEKTREAISAGMSAQILKIQDTDFEEKAKKILSQEPLLSARDVEVTFSLRGSKLTAIRRTSLDLYEGETLAIVGESGSGKSVFTKCFVGMLDKNGAITNGSILYDGQDLTQLTEKDWLKIRGKKIAMVTQDPMTSLNPLKTIGYQIRRGLPTADPDLRRTDNCPGRDDPGPDPGSDPPPAERTEHDHHLYHP